LVYADEINLLGGRVNAKKEKSETLLEASRYIDAEKTKYMIMSFSSEFRTEPEQRVS
jgi:hypothetical protein